MTRVIVVDDQTLVREGIRTLLDIADVEVVGEASDGLAALDVIADTSPDVVLLDLRMPEYDGLWTLAQLAQIDDPPPVLILTTFDDDTLVLDALRAGAHGYMLKDVTVEQLTRAVGILADGGTFVAPSITDRMLRAIRTLPHPDDSAGPVQELTAREGEVLRLMAEGYGNRDISQVLFLAEGTVKNHVSTILLKLGARDRTNAVLRALHLGLLR